MATHAELIAARDALKEARYSGSLRVRHGEKEVEYKSDTQMASALAAIEADLANLSRVTGSRTFTPRTNKGLS